MSERLPLFRADIAVSLHEEDGENYLVLNDVFQYAEGPIMIHSDMMAILDACDGETTWDVFAIRMGVAPDSAPVLQARSFIAQLAQMGYFDDETYATKRIGVDEDWNALEVRPSTCAGNTYPQDADALKEYLDDLLASTPEQSSQSPENGLSHGFLIPHIDFRVAPQMYGEAFRRIGELDADLFVIVGTSHYWGDHRVILTRKHFDTPLGVLEVDRDLVTDVEMMFRKREIEGQIPILAPTDIAHKPEHSIELHAVWLKHVTSGRPVKILPILVTGVGGEHDPDGVAVLEGLADDLRAIVEGSGRKAAWLISGDLAHVGMRFGDEISAREMLTDVGSADRELLAHLEKADPWAYHQAYASTDMRFRVCGHAPTLLALFAARPRSGEVLAYDLWDDSETHSAVTFASVAFSR